jgi:subtilase family serine protease
MRTALVVTSVLAFAACQPAASAQPDRITTRIDNRQLAVLPGSVHPKAQPRFDQGAVEGSMRLPYVTLLTKPSASQQINLDRLLSEQQDPASRNFHKWLTPEQYADRFGLSQNDIAKLTAWLRAQGFSIIQTARGRDWIAFSGNAGQVETAFHTAIHYYDMDGERHFANATEVSIPAALSGIVTAIRGLNDFRWKPMGVRSPIAHGAIFPNLVRPFFTAGGQHFLAPDDLATIYDLDSLYSAGIDGSGMKLAVVGQADINLNEIDEFRSGLNLSKNDPVVVNLAGHGPNNNDAGEAYLDLEWSGAVARNATIYYVNSGNAFDSAIDAIDQDLAPVISMSFGGCESENAGFIPSNEPTMQKANSLGITFMASSGDSGAAACDEDTVASATMGLAVNYPASSPEVTGVGGTEFSGDVNNPNQYWSATNGPNLGSALSYIPETAWNDTVENGSLSASGGGASSCGQATETGACSGGFPKPSWQTGPGVPKDGVRDVPDVAMTASADHDGYLLCSSDTSTTPPTDTCANGVANDLLIAGGTSASTPVFAGIITLLNQSLGNVPPAGLGNINKTLYQLAPTTSNGTFHDITTGNNMVPCTKGTTDCAKGGTIGYNAGPGYSQVTGLGSVDAAKLFAAWGLLSGKKAATSTNVSFSPSTIVADTNFTFSAAVTHASGTVAPTGTVTFSNGPTVLGSGPLASSGQASFATSALVGGTYSVTAAYSGDTNYAGSISTASVLNVEDFETPTANPTTVNVSAPGQSGTTAITITPINGFNQAVSFSCIGLPSEATCTFNPSTVTPNNGTAAKTTLTISTTADSAGLQKRRTRQTAVPIYAFFLPGVLGLVFVGRDWGKRPQSRRLLLALAFLLTLTAYLPACGGGGSGNSNTGTPTGSSTITIAATATTNTSLSHSTFITLNVQ